MIKKYSLVLVAFLCFVLYGFGQTTITSTFSSFGFTNAQTFPSGSIDSNISFSTQINNPPSTPPAYYTIGSAIRFYNDSSGDGNSITLIPSNGAIITDVELYTYGSYTPDVKYNVDGAVDVTVYPSSTTYTIASISAATSLKMRNASSTPQLRLTGINVTYTIPTSPKYYQSKATGPNNWNIAGSWESSDDNITWANAAGAPTKDAMTITIRTGHTITVDSSISLDETVVNGTLETLSGAVLNINDGTGIDLDIKNGGVLNVKNPNSETYSNIVNQSLNASINVATGGKIAVLGNGTSVASAVQRFATNALNIWNNNAVYEWNCSVGTPGLSGETYFPNANSATIPVFRIIVQNSTNSLGGGSSTVINGLFETSTNLSFQGIGLKTFGNGIKGNNATITFPSSIGPLSLTSSTAVLSGTLTIVLNRQLNLTNGANVTTGSLVIIDNSSTSTIQKQGGIFNVEANAIFDIGTNCTMSNTSGNVTVSGTFRTGNTNGFTGGGSSLPTGGGVVILNPNCTVELNRNNGMPQNLTARNDFKNLLFSGSGTKTISSAFNPMGLVNITGNATLDVSNSSFGNGSTNLKMDSNSRFRMSGVGTKPDITGTYDLQGGVVEFYNSGTALTENIRGTSVSLPIQYYQIEVTGNKVGNSNANITLNDFGSFTIKNGGVFEMTDNSIVGPTGTQTLTVESNGLFKCAIASGFYGAAAIFPNPSPAVRNNIETIVLQSGSTVNYNRASPPLSGDGSQTLTNVYSNGLPIGYQNLVISGTGTKSIGADIGIEVNENLSVLSATLRIDGDLFNSEPSKYISVNDNVTVANGATLDVKTNGSLIQVADTGTFTLNAGGTATVYKRTAPLNTPAEYTYWSSPVTGEKIETALFESNPNRIYLFKAQNYLDKYKESGNNNVYILGQDDIDDFPGDDWQQAPQSMTMIPGVGYAATLNPIGFIASNTRYEFNFNGPFNTKTINVPVYRNDLVLADNNWNFIGNPYPSAISVDNFFSINRYDASTNLSGILQGAIYLWSQSSPASNSNNGNEVYNFNQSDYAIINGASELSGGDNNGDGVINALDRPKRFIPSGQGFFVAFDNNALSTTVSPNIKMANVEFNNAMRMKDDTSNTQFFRTSNTDHKSSQDGYENKLWLNLTSNNGVFNQISVAYVNGATNAYDGFYYDAPRNLSTGAHSILYSTIDGEQTLKLAIQGRNPTSLTLDEVIPLGFYTSINQATIYTLSLVEIQGEFLTLNTIYLTDKLLNVIHNLSRSDYSFTSQTGEFNKRFEIVFKDQALSVLENEIQPNGLSIIELHNGQVKFSVSNNLNIKSIEILDMLGRTLYHLEGNNPTEIYELPNLSQAAYIAKVKLSNGQVITKRAVKRK